MYNRRQALKQIAAVSVGVGVAGCSGSEQAGDGGDEGNDETPISTATPAPTATPALTPTETSSLRDEYPNAAAIHQPTGIVIEEGIESELDSIGSLYIRGTAINASDQDYEYVQLEWSVYNEANLEGDKIGSGLANISGLPAGQSWRFEALAASVENAASFNIADVTAY